MVRKEQYIGLGLDTDTAPDKRKPDTYWDAENIRIINNSRGMSIKPILGETLILELSNRTIGITDYPRLIVGYIVFMETIYIFTTTDDSATTPSASEHYDAIYKVDSTETQYQLIESRFGFCQGNRIDAVANYETEDIIKLYWVDGYNMLRYVNVSGTAITLSRATEIGVVDVVTLSTPTVAVSSGGNLIAGTVQYCYNLYYQHGSQSNLSPTSRLISITNYFKGYESQEDTGLKVEVAITGIDTAYDAIKVYSIHYQELNQSPKISLIYDAALQGISSLTLYDDGNLQIAELSASAILAISYSPITPNTLAIKRDRLFVGNYESTNFDPAVDMRAYSYAFGVTTGTYLKDDVTTTLYTNAQLNTLLADHPLHDAVNPDLDTYMYKIDGATKGGTGLNLEYSFYTKSVTTNVIPEMSLKQGEIYRIGITLYDVYGQASPVKWIADVKVPEVTNTYTITGININMLTARVSYLTGLGIVSYQLCIVERKPEDRTILAQGFIVPSVQYIEGGLPITPYYHPHYITKDIIDASNDATIGANIEYGYLHGADYTSTSAPIPTLDTSINFFYSSDTLFETSMIEADYIRFLGTATSIIGTDGFASLKMWEDNIQTFASFVAAYTTEWGALGSGYPEYIFGISGKSGTTTVLTVFENTFDKNYTAIVKHPVGSRPANAGLESTEFLKIGETKVIDAGATASNSIQIPNLLDGFLPTYLPVSYTASFANAIVLNFDTNTWHKTVANYDKFDVSDIRNSAPTLRGLPVAELIRTLANQYGGNSYEDKQRNEYLKIGNIRTVNDTVNIEYLGDIFIAPLSVNRCEGTDAKIQGSLNIIEYVNLPYMENNHNVLARTDNMNNWKSNLSTTNNYNYFRIADNHKLLGAYNQKPTLFKGYAVPFNFSVQEKYPLSVLGSNAKNANEVLDSWLVFNPNNTKLLEGQYGTITKLHNLNGELVVVQSTGIAMLAVEPRIQTQGNDGYQVSLGIGALFYDHRYLTTVTGSNTKFSITDDGKNLYYYDTLNNTLNTLQEGKLSTLKTVKKILDDYYTTYSTGPHTTTYYNKLDQVYFQFNTFTLVYDILLSKFTSKHDMLNSNKWLIPNGNNLYQIDDTMTVDLTTTSLYTCFTNGTVKPAKIVYLMAPDPTMDKVFHNLEYRLEGANFTTIKVNNERSASATVVPDIKTKFDIHRIHLPRVANSRERFRGIYILVELNNTDQFALDNLVLMYNIKG